MATIHQQDLIDSIADSLQFISYYHPIDFIKSMRIAYEHEMNPIAKRAIAQLLINSRLCAENHRPLCQDTGIVSVFLKIGMDVQWKGFTGSLEEAIHEGVRRAYLNPDNKLRASIVTDPAHSRKNTRDNTPAVVHTQIVLGSTVEVIVVAKGGGSEAKSQFVMLNPFDSITDWVLKTVPTMGAGWCPPGLLGIGIGGTAEKAMLLAKEALIEPINIQALIQRGPQTHIEAMRIELYEKINALGIGAQGLGGLCTVLDVKIKDYPTHAANLPVGMVPNCAATRHIHFVLDGSGPAILPVPTREDWPDITQLSVPHSRRVDLSTITKAEIAHWQWGETLLLSGKLLTGRDAAHQRLIDQLNRQEKLPVDLHNRIIYYVGPVDPVHGEVIGPAGPTTATRMDKFTPQLLAQTGLLGMIGKAERGPMATEAIKEHGAVYLIAVGGAAYLISKAIKSSRIVAFEDLGMEAIFEFEVVDMPVTVAVDSKGRSIHMLGPKKWKTSIASRY